MTSFFFHFRIAPVPIPSISVFPPVVRASPAPRASSAFTHLNASSSQLPILRQTLQRLLSTHDDDLAPYEPDPETNANSNAHDARYPASSYPIPAPSYPAFALTPSSSPRHRPSLLDRISSPPTSSTTQPQPQPQPQTQRTPSPATAVRYGCTRSNAHLAPPSSTTQAQTFPYASSSSTFPATPTQGIAQRNAPLG